MAQPPADTISTPIDAHLERARDLDFYRYYEPFCESTSDGRPSSDNLPDGVARHSSDPSLQAFAQLGALRLRARRCMISCFDRTTQYVFAEATRSLSLGTGDTLDSADALWFGSSSRARGQSLCERVADTSIHLQPEDLAHGLPVTVIPDLLGDASYKSIALGLGPPHPRFYASVPIISPNGFAIGTYCILDEHPRHGLEAWEAEFLQNMATTVMAHLEMVRAKAENARSHRMIKGLARLSKRTSLRKTDKARRNRQGTSTRRPESTQNSSSALSMHIARHVPHEPSLRDKRASLGSDTSQGNSSFVRLRRPHDTSGRSRSARSRSPSELSSTDADSDTPESNLRSTFETAAASLGVAMELGGCLYLDARPSSFGGLVDVDSPDTPFSVLHHSAGRHGSVSTSSAASKTSHGNDDEKTAPVLAFSRPVPTHRYFETEQTHPQSISERFLTLLLRQYPNGKRWDFDVEEALSGDSQKATKDIPLGETPQARNPAFEVNRQGRRAQERDILRKVFPQAQHVAFSGLWDSHRQRWFAACFVWTYDPLRTFSPDFELPFLVAAGESLMAEIARLDVNTVTKAKNDLLSSISHELRSPLHGILGCTECLKDSPLDAFEDSLVNTAETCTKTLLDTIDHLLEYANISHFSQRPNSEHVEPGEGLGEIGQQPQLDALRSGPTSLENDVDLCSLVEEVVESAYAGHDWVSFIQNNVFARPGESEASVFAADETELLSQIQHRKSSLTSTGKREPIVVILDVPKGTNSDWVFRTQAGAWRRLLLNLVSNSLKFTKKGYIRVSLKFSPTLDAHLYEATLAVTDSGKGIRSDFLADIFEPWSKEDSSTSGTGLGLRLVHDIVSRMHGTVDVDSAPGRGTQVKVTIPGLVRSRQGRKTVEQDEMDSRAERIAGMRLNFVGTLHTTAHNTSGSVQPRDASNAWTLFQRSFKSLCKEWFDVEATFSARPEPADIYITTADSVRGSIEHKEYMVDAEGEATMTEKPLLVLCDSVSSARELSRKEAILHTNRFTEYISQPCGPRKLTKAIASCLDRQASDGLEQLSSTRQKRTLSQQSSAKVSSRSSSSSLELAGNTTRPGTAGQSSTAIPQNTTDSRFSTIFSLSEVSEALAPPLESKSKTKQPWSGESKLQSRLATRPIGQMIRTNTMTRPGLSVLLVDDNPVNLSILTVYMKKNNHKYQTASNGQEAVEAYKKALDAGDVLESSGSRLEDTQSRDGARLATSKAGRISEELDEPRPLRQAFEYVLMDLTMPVMDGLESTRRIRALERVTGARPAKIVALTALASASVQQEAFASGMDLFYTKPVRMKELAEIMKPYDDSKGE